MTCTEIVVAALDRLGRGTDDQTVDNYWATFLQYANRAIRIIARKYKACRKETVPLTDGVFSTDQLERECVKIVRVVANGQSVGFEQDVDGSGEFTCNTTATEATVYYRFLPKLVVSHIEEPELPRHMHVLITHYIVACERCGGDPDTQGTSSADFEIFNSLVAAIESCKLGQASAYTLDNY